VSCYGRINLGVLLGLSLCFVSQLNGSSQTRPQNRQPGTVFTVITEPGATVWIDEIRRGSTDDAGRLAFTKLSPGRHLLRVRANGFKEVSVPWLPGRKQTTVKLVRTTDEAELVFQQAETAREQARDEETRAKAAELYQRALKLRPAFPAARVGLARVWLELNEYEKALAEIEEARRVRRVFPEASAVEGRIHREAGYMDEATRSFRRAIAEARGFQPEAHVGLARLYEEKAQYAEAIAEYRKAIEQLSDSEPLIYQLLGAAYERLQNYKEAISAYENYLKLAPNGSLAPAIRSILDQLRREAAGQEIVP